MRGRHVRAPNHRAAKKGIVVEIQAASRTSKLPVE